MSDLPVALPAALTPAFVAAFDRAGKIVRSLESLGPVADRDVLLVDAEDGPIVEGLRRLGARISVAPVGRPLRLPAPDASVDAVIGLWSAFRGVEPADIAEVDRALRPGGRLLVVHDYGRDDVSRLYADTPDRPEYGPWSHRSGPFLSDGFRVRVVHCFWEWPTVEDAAAFLGAAFGAPGTAVGAALKRPRLSYNVAVYHRSRP